MENRPCGTDRRAAIMRKPLNRQEVISAIDATSARSAALCG